MVEYPTPQHGDKTVSADETLSGDKSYRVYNNLTIDAGATFTVPHQSQIYVVGTFTLEGTLSVQREAGAGAGGTAATSSSVPNGGDGGYGGRAGGSALLAAQEIIGSGKINISGEDAGDGGDGDTGTPNENHGTTSPDNGGDGTEWEIASLNESGTIPGGGVSGENGGDSSAPTGGSGGSGVSTVPLDNNLQIKHDEDYIIPAHSLNRFYRYSVLPSSGGGGGGGGCGNYYTNDDNYTYSGSGGGGGAGGGLGYSTSNAQNGGDGEGSSGQSEAGGGGGGGGGGGSGGVLFLYCGNISTDININASGGAAGTGGAGGTATASGGDGGDGTAGSGGWVEAWIDSPISIDVSGGASGMEGFVRTRNYDIL